MSRFKLPQMPTRWGTQTFRGADVLAPECGELETVRLFGGGAQLVGCLLEQRGCSME